MTQVQKAGIVLLSVWLILAHLVPVLGINIPNLERILTLVGVIAGGALMIGFAPGQKGKRRSKRATGLLLLGAWLILVNLLPFLGIDLGNGALVLNVVAVAAGVFLLAEPE
jgi:peptidoglycan/LPS O-acetylase OafA/YrhL